MQPTISMIINCHQEGIIAHKSLLCFENLRNKVETQNKNLLVEWIIIIDNGNAETQRVIKNFKLLRDTDQIHEVQFGDPAPARNFGLSQASGQYVAFLDADNLYSTNWIDAAYQLGQHSDAGLVFHPQYVLSFEGKHSFVIQPNQTMDLVYNLLKHNLWDLSVFAERQFLLQLPYLSIPRGNGFGYEDWHWNCEAIAAKLQHRVVPHTTLFYRVKEKGSRGQEHRNEETLLPATQLFNQLEVI